MAIYGATVSTAPTFSSAVTGIGTRSISWTTIQINFKTNRYDPSYAKFRIYDATISSVLYESGHFSAYSATNTTRQKAYSANTAIVTMPSSTTTHTIKLQYGMMSTSSGTPSSWSDIASYTVSVTGKRTFNIVYYDYGGSSYYSTTGAEASYHTVYTPTSLSKFDHWNTASDDSGTSYLPGSTRYVNGNLYFYAIRGAGVVIKTKVSGSWVDAEPKVKVNGAWVDVSDAYVKVNGTWKQIQ